MNTNNNPPFRIGQRVVAIKTNPQGDFKNGDIKIIQGIKMGCCAWEVDIGCIENCYMQCPICGKIEDTENCGLVCWYLSDNFVPIEENKERIRYVAVPETLREKAEEVVVESCGLS